MQSVLAQTHQTLAPVVEARRRECRTLFAAQHPAFPRRCIDKGEGYVVPQGPFRRFYIGNYMTGYGGEQPGLYRIWYDNLIVSTSCITSCE